MKGFHTWDARTHRAAAGLAAVGLVATILVLPVDGWLISVVSLMRTEGGRHVMLVVTALGEGIVDFALAGVVAAAGWMLGRSNLVDAGLRAAVAVAAAGIVSQLLKHVACRARPGAPGPGTFFHGVPCVGGDYVFFSFPSGHAATAVALGLVLGLRVPALRVPAAVGAGVVMLSRIYLGAHFPSDVAAGATLGLVAGMLAGTPAKS